MRALLERLPGLREAHRPDVVVVNAENAAAGAGTSPRQAQDLLDAGVDVLTGGNHTSRSPRSTGCWRAEPRMLRPANIAVRAPGRGLTTVESPAGPVSVVNVHGRVFLTAAQSPFAVIDDLVERARGPARAVVLVDIHAEATSEKIAHGLAPRRRVSAVVGTHTHVQTADARVLPGGTAYITDLGMTGPHDSVIGVRTEIDPAPLPQRGPRALRAGRRGRAGPGRGRQRRCRRPGDRDRDLQPPGLSFVPH